VFVRKSRITLTNMEFSCNLEANKVASDVFIADDLDPNLDGSFVSCKSAKQAVVIFETDDSFSNTDCPFTGTSSIVCPF
jgi:hypothetical protein